jgi:uncharacterized Zn finger protein
MAKFSRTWWGQRFIAALEEFTDGGRLGRGRSYATNGRILKYTIADGKVTATVRGSINPYYGVYKEPRYTTTIFITPIRPIEWTKVIDRIAMNAGFVAKLLMNEMPDTIEDAFRPLDLFLLPHGERDFVTTCSCPDYANPCKHIAGVYYVLAAELDRDPFLMFELRGLSREKLREELARSPLGQILSSEMTPQEVPITPATSYYPRPEREPPGASVSLREFWAGAHRLPAPSDLAPPSVPALLIKKQGDYPAFWKKDLSFIAVMEDLYERVRTKNSQMK